MDTLTNTSNHEGHLGLQVSSPDTQTKVQFVWTWPEIVLAVPLGLIVIGTIIGNFLVLYACGTRPRTLRQPTHILIANLAVADFLVGVFVMPFLAVGQVTGRWYFGSIYCDCWTIIHFWLCSASILSTCAICIERYIGVRFPLNHKSILNKRRIFGIILFVWSLAAFKPFCSLYIWPQPKSGREYVCDLNLQVGHVLMSVVGILYVPAIIMVILYGNIYLIAKRHLRFMRKHSAVPVSTSSTDSFGSGAGQRKGWGSFLKKNSIKVVPNKKITDSLDQGNVTSESSISSNSRRGSNAGNLEQLPNNLTNMENKNTSNLSSSSMSAIISAPMPMSPSTKRPNSALKSAQSKKQIDLARRLSLLVGVVLVTYLPYFTLYLVMALSPVSVDIQVFNAFGWIRYFNSCVNPFIYALAVPAYRKAMTEIVFTGFGCCHRSRESGTESK